MKARVPLVVNGVLPADWSPEKYARIRRNARRRELRVIREKRHAEKVRSYLREEARAS